MYICPNCGNQEFEMDYPLTLTFNSEGNIIDIEDTHSLMNTNVRGIYPLITDFDYVTCKKCREHFNIEELNEEDNYA